MKTKHLLLLAVMLLYLSFVVPNFKRPATIDEAVFLEAVKSVLETGKPTINKLLTVNTTNITGADKLHAYHPTLYINILAFAMWIFGENIYVLRLVGAFFMLITAIIVFLIALVIHYKYPEK